MSVESDKLIKLSEPFGDDDIEWRIQSAGRKGAKVWARVLCYLTNRAIQHRLDTVCGPGNWKNEYRELPNLDGKSHGCLCGISIRVDGEWVTKWDGADNTATQPIKGGLSDSMKRAAVQWGMGRHLYGIGDNFADIVSDRQHATYSSQVTIDGSREYVHWNPPRLKDAKVTKRYESLELSESKRQRNLILVEINRVSDVSLLDRFAERIETLAGDGKLDSEDAAECLDQVDYRKGVLAEKAEANGEPATAEA